MSGTGEAGDGGNALLEVRRGVSAAAADEALPQAAAAAAPTQVDQLAPEVIGIPIGLPVEMPTTSSSIEEAKSGADAVCDRLQHGDKPSAFSPKSYSLGQVRKWFRMDGLQAEEQLVADADVNAELRKLGPTKLLNLIMICGPARKGKSFLMNALAQLHASKSMFPVSAANMACTSGVDISPNVVPLQQLAADKPGDAFSPIETEMQIGFLDAEGQGDRGVDYDIQLVAPLLLLTQCVIFNWSGKPEKDTMLQKLGCLAKAAQRIDTSREDEKKKPFGHLHIVLRDNPDLTGVESLLLEDEGAEFLARGKPLPADFAQRNQIRSLLKQGFESIQLWGFHPPVKDLSQPFTIADVGEDFAKEVAELRAELASQLATARTLQDKPLTGVSIAGMARALAHAVNENASSISPSSAFSAMQQIEVRDLEQRLSSSLTEYIDALCEAVSRQPHAAEALERLFEVACDERQASYRTGIASLLPESQMEQGASRLVESWGSELSRLLGANENAHMQLKGAQDEVLVALGRYASDRRAELEELKNIKDRDSFALEIDEEMRRLVEESFPAIAAEHGLQGGFPEARERLREAFMVERPKLVMANRNAQRRANGEVIIPMDIQWKEEWRTELRAVVDITGWKKSDKNQSTLYRIAVSLGPMQGQVAAPIYREMLEEIPGKVYCISVWRNYGHLQWLHAALRSDSSCKAEMSGARLSLPPEAGPRSVFKVSTWFGPVHKDMESRMPYIVDYFQRLLMLEQCARSQLLKIFFSPDDLFRPVRRAVKKSWITSTDKCVQQSLAKVVSPYGARFLRERCDGARILCEQQCFTEATSPVDPNPADSICLAPVLLLVPLL